MKKKIINLKIDINLEMSEDLYERVTYKHEKIDFVIRNAFRNNARRVNSVTCTEIEKL